MATFVELGLELPLFAADVEEASAWSADGACAICGEAGPGFTLGIDADIVASCSACGSEMALPADGDDASCPSCDHGSSLPDSLAGDHACWRCLRSGRWASTMDTEAGMVRWADARRGRTHGVPFEQRPVVWTVGDGGASSQEDPRAPEIAGFPTTEPDDDGWRGAVIPTGILLELLRTPAYVTWQGERWLFHCRRAMRYIGRWGRSQFDTAAGDGDGRSLAAATAGLDAEAWDHGLADEPSAESGLTVYMFRCAVCGAHRGHWDVD